MPGTGPNNREEPSGSLASDRLDSWKEIAAYLKRDERTVRRWEEREGLPIHRHQHKSRAAIFAYKSELDAWWNNGQNALETQEQAQGGSEASATLGGAGRRVAVDCPSDLLSDCHAEAAIGTNAHRCAAVPKHDWGSKPGVFCRRHDGGDDFAARRDQSSAARRDRPNFGGEV